MVAMAAGWLWWPRAAPRFGVIWFRTRCWLAGPDCSEARGRPPPCSQQLYAVLWALSPRAESGLGRAGHRCCLSSRRMGRTADATPPAKRKTEDTGRARRMTEWQAWRHIRDTDRAATG